MLTKKEIEAIKKYVINAIALYTLDINETPEFLEQYNQNVRIAEEALDKLAKD